ncbi:fimbrillin family protein, partial [Bacteroides fragilis]|nr:fimbrillin family protein [Bacteroides fragilis]
MKKYFLFSAMAAVALASCTNDDVVDVNKGGGISFRASLDKA